MCKLMGNLINKYVIYSIYNLILYFKFKGATYYNNHSQIDFNKIDYYVIIDNNNTKRF